MDVTFTPEQLAFRDTIRNLLTDLCPSAHVRNIANSEGVDLTLYNRVLDLGFMELPTQHDRCLLFEEAGRTLVPGPLVSAFGVALPILEAADSTRALVDEVAAGRIIPILVTDPHRVTDAQAATHFLLTDDDHVLLIPANKCSIEPLPSLDATRRVSQITVKGDAQTLAKFTGTEVQVAEHRARVALAHELVGVAQACLDLAVSHAQTRKQFDRPIGAYQAISHMIVDMYVAVELARSHADFAAWAVEEPIAEADQATSQAQVAASEAALLCAQSAMQVHSGIGFTWEHDLHLYLRRARTVSALLGTQRERRERIADLMGLA